MLKTLDLRPRATGDTWPIAFDLVGADLEPLTTAADHTYELSMNVDENPTDRGTDLFTLTGEIVDGVARLEFSLTQPEADLLVVLPDQAAYWYDLRVTSGAGKTATILKGRQPITGPITP